MQLFNSVPSKKRKTKFLLSFPVCTEINIRPSLDFIGDVPASIYSLCIQSNQDECILSSELFVLATEAFEDYSDFMRGQEVACRQLEGFRSEVQSGKNAFPDLAVTL